MCEELSGAGSQPGARQPEPTARKNLLGISKSSVNRITKQHLKLHLYKISDVQETAAVSDGTKFYRVL